MPAPRTDRLSPREVEVLALVALGYTQTTIARGLRIDVNTVKSHLRRITAALGSRNATHSVVVASQLGLLDLDALGDG